jgi:hypothetical protein
MPEATNGIDPGKAKLYVGGIQAKFGELLSLRGSYMADCKAVRQDIKDLKEAANDDGIPRKSLNLLLKELDFEKKLKELRDEAEEDVSAITDMIREALGEDFSESPLGDAAIRAAEAAKASKSAKASAQSSEPKRGRGRPKGSGKKAADNVVSITSQTAAKGSEAIDSLVDSLVDKGEPQAGADAKDEPDLRPKFLQDKDAVAAADNAVKLAGLKQLN